MKKRWKKIWVAALRGGNFKQGRNSLRRDDNTCCCLGVLADLMGAKWERFLCSYNSDLQNGQYLSADALAMAGLTHAQQKTLAGKNDYGDTFNQIADYIENAL